MAVFKCKMCGGALAVKDDLTTTTCEYCGSQQTLPRLNDDKLERLYDRANHFRRNNEFDKAMGIYEQILDENNEDAESYWSIVLCKYGIEYVEDPASHKRVPTINRTQFTSIFDDDNYKSALKYADISQKIIYEKEAATINEIQKGILDISQKEEPFDVFICYKETDANGKRTYDSVYANELYHELTAEGFKVFFARITLEDKLGIAYEPYIFAALNSAKVMVVIGTKAEYFNAVWVKNEWSRYLTLIKNGEKKVLIPAYRDMDPYDLPKEFSHLQAQDMNKLGFMPDLVRGIKKEIGACTAKTEESYTKSDFMPKSGNIETLLKRITIFLEDCDWEHADVYCDKVLDIDPENAKAYIGKLLAQLQITKEEDLVLSNTLLEGLKPYRNALRFADEDTAKRLVEYGRVVKEKITKRQEQARIEEEKIQEQARKEEQRRQEINALQTEKNNMENLLSAQINEKEQLQVLIANKQSEIQRAITTKKLQKYSLRSVIPALFHFGFLFCFLFIMPIILPDTQPGGTGAILILILVPFIINEVIFMVYSAKLLKADGKSSALVIINFLTLGCYIMPSIFRALKETSGIQISKHTQEFNKKELEVLGIKLQQVVTRIDSTKHALSEINKKLKAYEQ